MISYDGYKNRIEKVAKAKAFIFKYKFLFIGMLAILIGGITALLVMKGTVTSAFVLPEQVIYGDEYSPSDASAFLSGVDYEYTLQDKEEWTAEKPVKVGKYFVRTVTNRAIGKGYGEPVAFEILKKEASLTFNENETSLIYGDSPEITLEGLVSDYDRIRSADCDFEYDTDDWTVKVSAASGSVRIVDKNGEDSSYCYSYTGIEKTFNLLKRAIRVELKSSADTYCGKVISYAAEVEGSTANTLAFNDKINVQTSVTQNGNPAEIINAGIYDINFAESDVKVTADGKDVTQFYEIKTVAGATYTVNKKPVTVTTDTKTKTYDGIALKAEGGSADGLVVGHTVSFKGEARSVTDKTDVGIENIRDFDILDEAGGTVTDNYEVTTCFGKLTVSPRPITVTTEDKSKIYDGDPLTGGGAQFEEGALVSGHEIYNLSYNVITGVKESGAENYVNFEIYETATGKTVTQNYAITEKFGTLTVTARPVTVETGSASRVYDGTELTATVGKPTGLVPGHSLSVRTAFGITDVAETKAGNNETKYYIYNGYRNVTDNYAITYINGTLTVEKRDFGIKSNDGNWTYNGGYYSDNGYTPLNGLKLAPNQYVYVSEYPSVKDVTDGTPNIFAYEIRNSAGTDVTANYNLATPVWGTLKVLRRKITVKLNDVEAIYGDTPVYVAGNEATNLVSGHTVSVGNVTFNNEKSDVGTYTGAVTCNESDIEIYEGSAEVTGNYEITSLTAGTLTITERKISVTLEDLTITYGGAISYAGKNYKEITSDKGLADGETLTVLSVTYSYTKSVPDIGTYDIYEKSHKVEKGGADVTDNYEIDFAAGTLTVEQRKITLTSASRDDWTYDGTTRFDENYTLTGTLAAGQSITVASHTTVCDYTAGTENKLTYTVYNGTEDVTHNYGITETNGTLKVNKREIAVTLEDLTVTYGDTISYAGKNYKEITSDTKLVQGETLTVISVKFGFTNPVPVVSFYSIAADKYNVEKKNGDDSTDNYNIVFTAGTLKVEKRVLTVATKSNSWEYNGKERFEEGYDIKDGTLAPEQIIFVTGNTKVKDVCANVPNVLTAEIRNKSGENVTANYDFTVESVGRLTVTPRVITVTLGNINAVYGDENYNYNGGEKADRLAEGHTVSVDASEVTVNCPVQPDAITHTEVVSCQPSAVTVKAGDAEVTANYSITVKAGSLIVGKKDLNVSLLKVEDKVYDGQPLGYETGTENYASADGLVYGQRLELNVKWDKTPLNAGKYKISFDGAKIYEADGVTEKEKGANNYKFVCSSYNVSVSPKPINIKLNSFEKTYDGDKFAYPSGADNYAVAESTPAAVGEHIEVTVYFTHRVNRVDPISAGEYEIEFSVITQVTGTNNYAGNYSVVTAESGILNVKRREISVKVQDEKYIYGDNINNRKTAEVTSEVKPVGNDVPEIVLHHYTYEDGTVLDWKPAEVGKYYIIPTLISMFNGDSNVTGNYKITYDGSGILTILPRNIRLVTNTASWVYDGNTHGNDGFKLFIIEDGREVILSDDEKNKISVTYAPTVTNVGDGVVTNEVKYDFSNSNYKPSEFEYGTISVTCRPLTVTTPSGDPDWIYDGTAHARAEVTVEGFIDAHKGKYTVSGFPEIADAGAVTNSCTLTLNSEIADNYEITSTTYGTLKVKPRPITVETGSGEWTYDGKPHTNDKFVSTYLFGDNTKPGLIGGDGVTLVVVKLFEVVCVTGENGTPNGTTFKTQSAEAVKAANYEIKSYDCGTLKITPMSVTVTLSALTVTYGNQYPSDYGNYDTEKTTGVADGDKLRVAVKYLDKDGTEVENAKNIGGYTVIADKDNCYVYSENDAGKNAIYNYDFTFVDGSLTVEPKEITVELLSYTDEVYGELFKGYKTGVNNFNNPSTTLAYGETLEVTVKYLDGESKEIIPEERTPAGAYTIAVCGYVIRDAAGKVLYESASAGLTGNTGNYIVNSVESGTLKINKRPVYIVRKGDKKEYDGIPLSLPDYEKTYTLIGNLEKAGLLEGEENAIKPFSANSIINVGREENTATYELNPDFAPSANYEIAGYINAYLEIYHRTVTIGLLDIAGGEYTGKAFTYSTSDPDYNLISGSLVDGEKLDVEVAFVDGNAQPATPKNAGVYFYSFDLVGSVVTESKGGAGIANYNIICTDLKSFEITRRTVEIKLEDMPDGDYDGNTHEHSGNFSIVGEKTFADGENLNVALDYYSVKDGNESAIAPKFPKNAGSYRIKFNAKNSVIGSVSADVNYIITCADVDFCINKVTLAITANDETREYNSEEYDYNAERKNLVADGLANGERIEFNSITYDGLTDVPTDAGKYAVQLSSFNIYSVGGEVTAGNYEFAIQKLSFTLEITRKKATAEIADKEIERPAEAVSPYVAADITLTGFIEGDGIMYDYLYTDKEGGTLSAVSALGEYTVNAVFKEVVTKNYDITVTKGTLTITARKVSVQATYIPEDVPVYNGEAIALDKFSFRHWHTPDETEKEAGFLNGDDAEYGKYIVYSFEKDGKDYGGTPKDAGVYTVKVNFNPAISENDYLITFEPSEIIVKRRPVKATVTLDKDGLKLTYSHTLLSAQLDGRITVSPVEEDGTGILPQDSAEYKIERAFLHETRGDVKYDFAGGYLIKAKLNKNDGNYFVEENGSTWAEFEVRPVTLYIKPVGYSVDYVGADLSYGITDYKILYGGLVGNDNDGYDSITLTGSNVLTAPRASVSVTIAGVTVEWNGEDVTDCYDLHYTYVKGDELTEENGWTKADFTAILSFKAKEIRYTLKPFLNTSFVYSGNALTLADLGVSDVNELFDFIDSPFAGDRFEVKLSASLKMPGSYKNYLSFTPYVGSGKALALYKFVPDNPDGAPVIVINKRTVEITFDPDIENYLDTEYGGLENSQYEGYKVITDKFTVSGDGFLAGHSMEVLAIKNEDGTYGVKVIIFQQSGTRRADRSMYYSVSSNIDVEYVNVSSLNQQ